MKALVYVGMRLTPGDVVEVDSAEASTRKDGGLGLYLTTGNSDVDLYLSPSDVFVLREALAKLDAEAVPDLLSFDVTKWDVT